MIAISIIKLNCIAFQINHYPNKVLIIVYDYNTSQEAWHASGAYDKDKGLTLFLINEPMWSLTCLEV